MRVRGTPHPEMVTADGGRFSSDGVWVLCSGAAVAQKAGFTRGRITANVWPVRGRAKAYTSSQSYRVRPPDRGRRPRKDQTRRAIGLSPSLAWSSAHTSTALSGLARRSRVTRRLKFFSTGPGSGRRPRRGGPGGGPGG